VEATGGTSLFVFLAKYEDAICEFLVMMTDGCHLLGCQSK